MLPPNFVFYRRGAASIWVDRDWATASFVDSLGRVEKWFDDPNCQIVKDQEKTKVGRLKINIAGHEQSVYVKQFNSSSLRYWVTAFFAPSRALRALQGAAILRAARILSAVPLAAVEKRNWRTRGGSFFVSREVAGGKTADAFWREALGALTGREGFRERRAFLRGLAKVFRTLHAQRIYHDDLKDANILAVSEASGPSIAFFLLDLEGVKRCLWLSERRKVKNLVQLHRTLGRYLASSEKIYFLKSYLGEGFFDRRSKRRLVARALRLSRAIDAQKSRQRWAVAESIAAVSAKESAVQRRRDRV